MRLAKILTFLLIPISGCVSNGKIQEYSGHKLSKEVTNAIALCSAGFASADAGVLSAQLISSGANIKGELRKIERGALDLSDPEMYKQYLTCVQNFLGNNITQKNSSTNATGTLTTNSNLSGAWDFQLAGNASVDKNGRKRNHNNQLDIRMNLLENKGIISGEYVWGTNNACTSAHVNGKKEGESVEFIVTYTGSCCRGAKMKFKGVLSSSKNLTGTFEPEGLPPAPNCNIWWARAVATKSD